MFSIEDLICLLFMAYSRELSISAYQLILPIINPTLSAKTMKTRKGFFLIEAILATALVGSSVLMRAGLEAKIDDKNKVNVLANDMSTVLRAMDRRVYLDGYNLNGGWGSSWSNSKSFLTDMIGKELISSDNPECGKVGGWNPSYPDNKQVALISCSMAMKSTDLLGFDVTSKREGTADSSGEVFKSWDFTLSYGSEKLFEENFLFYSDLLTKSKLYDNISLSSDHDIGLIDIRTGNKVSTTECFNISTSCGVQYKLTRQSYNREMYLRQDGQNAMYSNLHFKAKVDDADKLKCFRSAKSGDLSEVNCGLNIENPVHDGLELNAVVASVESIRLANHQLGGRTVPVPVRCAAQDGTQSFCGFSVVGSASSPMATGYVNNLYATDLIKSLGDINSGGRIVAKSNIESQTGGITALLNITSRNGDVLAQNGSIKAKDAVLSRKFSAVTGDVSGVLNAGIVSVANSLSAKRISASSLVQSKMLSTTSVRVAGTRCNRVSELGYISRDEYGGLLTCKKDGVWSAAGGGIHSYTRNNSIGWQEHPRKGAQMVSVPQHGLIDVSRGEVRIDSEVSVTEEYCDRLRDIRVRSKVVSCQIRVSGTGMSGCTKNYTYNGARQWCREVGSNDREVCSCNEFPKPAVLRRSVGGQVVLFL